MTRGQDVSRRSFIGGAAGIGAISAAMATLGLEGVARAEGEEIGTASGDESLSALALPPIVAPGVRIGAVNLADIGATDNLGPDAALQYYNQGVWNLAGWLNAPLQLPAGARLLRVDVFGRTIASLALSVDLISTVLGGTNTFIQSITTPAGVGVVQASYTPATPRTIAMGERVYLETFCNSDNKVFLGAIYQYYDANPQLNLLPVPIRVYDSRSGADPASVVKGPLANGAQRVIDCTYLSALPPGAAAAMITLTTVGTVGAGYMALWQNGLAYPGTSSVNWDHSGTNVAVTTVCAVDATAKLLALTGPGASTDFIIDVIGFYA